MTSAPASPALSPPRIASLVPSLTELLFDLGLGEHLVARTGFCVHPRDKVRRIPKVGGTKDVDISRLLATNPTHVVVNIDENRREAIATMRAHIPEIIVTHPLAPDDNLDLYGELGRLFGCSTAGESLAKQYREARGALAAAMVSAQPRKVLYLIWKDPWFTVSRDTYVSNLLSLANLHTIPIATSARYPTLGDGDGAWTEADCILLSSEPYAFRQRHVAELARALLPKKPVLLADGELLSWYGSRAIAGLAYLPRLRSRIDASLQSIDRHPF